LVPQSACIAENEPLTCACINEGANEIIVSSSTERFYAYDLQVDDLIGNFFFLHFSQLFFFLCGVGKKQS